MNIAITGHKGLIGTSLLRRLTQDGHEIVLAIAAREGFFVDSLENINGFDGKIDVFIHMADFCKINKTILYPVLGHKNGINSYRILEFCRRNKVPRVVYFSSSRILSREKNPYTAGKIYGEELCRAYFQCYGINYLILRPSTVYGPFNDITHRLTDVFIRNALRNRPLEIYGNPKTKTLDFTYIDDFIDGVMLAIENSSWQKEYNISGGREYKIYDFAKMIIEKTDSKSEIVIVDKEVAQPQEICVDISEIRKLGYDPQVSIEEGIHRCIDFYKELLKIE